MEIILLEKIRNVGNLGEKVKVRDGYGRNFLIPQKKALRATEKNLAEFEVKRAALEQKALAELKVSQDRAEALAKLNVIITAMASEEGKLFGSIGTRDIAAAITDAGVPVQKSEIRLPEGTLRFAGDYQIDIHLHSDVIQNIKVSIVSE
jgi:large subunit ribosomal protein L9